MRKLNCFNFISLNGFYKGANEDYSWHTHDDEGAKFSEENLKGGGTLVFGRVTFEMMEKSWTSEWALKNMPKVAEGMNKAEKIVFSNTLEKAAWQNTTLFKGDMIAEIKKLKQSPGNDMCILGSGNILAQLADHNLIDMYQLMIDPIVLAEGTPLFNNIKHRLNLKLTSTKAFKSGSVMLCYEKIDK
ncbi:MAG TPA: dihydrofolate reductase family protein [Bacteroidia bacterium]|jgi:dihydrofolate reductase|nr:dihydrofolate reductase family protein [Bacteroidia bacterium]